MDIELRKVNDVFMRVEAERSTLMELWEHLSFRIPNAHFHPKVKAKAWDGIIHMLNLRTQLIYIGLIHDILEFAEFNEYTVAVDKKLQTNRDITDENITKFFNSLNLPFEERYYQKDIFKHGFDNKRAVFLSPTGSGKSLSIYMFSRLFAAMGKKVLIIVPTVSLVNQIDSDFTEYNNNESLDTHLITGGVDKNVDAQITISTWQSIYKQRVKYFEKFDVVIGDECHKFKATSLVSIMEKCVNADYRFGFTGSLEDSQISEMTLKGLFGPVMRAATTKELMDQGILAKLNIKCLVIKYPEDECRILRKTQRDKKAKNKNANLFNEEINFLLAHEKRNEFIAGLTNSLEGNTLVLFRFVDKHGIPLHDLIQKTCKGKKVHYVAGSTDAEDREYIRKIVDKEKNSIIVASLGVFSTGINIKNINNIVFATPNKSKIITLQSIGRGLRISDTKSSCTLYDIVDDLRWKKYVNYSLKHFEERVSIYNEEEFDYKMYKYNLK